MTQHPNLSQILLIGALLPILAACSTLGLESDATYGDKQKSELYKNGSLASDEGGINIFGGPENKGSDAGGLGVNGFLWRATLDTLSFMPIASADPFGGTILTDWHSASPNERTKLNVFILGRELRADGVRVSVFRQTRDGNGAWTDSPVAAATAGALENTILTKARQLRMAQKQSHE